jgi:hypothetical protein
MDFPPALRQFVGSLVAILARAWIASGLRLGPAPKLKDEADARRIADQAISGYVPVALALDRDGKGALMRDADGRLLLIRQHGTHFAGRILTPGASARCEGEALIIDSGERHFGSTRLVLPDPQGWARAVIMTGAIMHA